jgi:xylem cysteine proteinase
MRSCFFALALTASAMTFPEWMEEQGKSYATVEEERYRELVFIKNKFLIDERNQKRSHITLGLNQFADVHPLEFGARLGYQPTEKMLRGSHAAPISYNQGPLPSNVDWVAKGAVTPVKNQGQCGSCWSFSSTGAVEGAWFLHTGDLVSLSEQQLVDCSGPEGNQGCNGGMMDQAFEYIIKNGGLCSEAAYPYISASGTSNSTCHVCEAIAHISSYVDVQPKNETALMAAVAQQPVSVAVEADGLDWQFYMGGVVTDACGTNLDHGVLVVGYGTDAVAGDYWTIKNSWGPTWGEQGYIRLGRGSKFAPAGECGILSDPSYPVV